MMNAIIRFARASAPGNRKCGWHELPCREISHGPSAQKAPRSQTNFSEHSVPARAVVVHDPTRSNAVGAFQNKSGHFWEESLYFHGIPDPELYQEQIRAFHKTLKTLGSTVYHLDDLLADADSKSKFEANPNQVFARDSAFTLPWAPNHYIGCNMAKDIRREEPILMKKALERLGLAQLVEIPPDHKIEGGDVIPFSYDDKRCLLIGYGPSTELSSVEHLNRMLIPDYLDEIIAIRISSRRINLDGAFCPVSENVVLVNLDSLLEARRYDAVSSSILDITRLLGELGLTSVVDVNFKDSRWRQACNCFCLGDGRVVMYNMCPHVADAVSNAGVDVHLVPGTELVKGNGGPRCMTRPIY